jgi:hypothetical protein
MPPGDLENKLLYFKGGEALTLYKKLYSFFLPQMKTIEVNSKFPSSDSFNNCLKISGPFIVQLANKPS